MAMIVFMQRRLTHNYVDSCSHLDRWGSEKFQFKLLANRPVKVLEDLEGGGVVYTRVIGSKKLDQGLQAEILQDNLSHHGCHHTYDCCGCLSISATVKCLKKGVFGVTRYYSYNY